MQVNNGKTLQGEANLCCAVRRFAGQNQSSNDSYSQDDYTSTRLFHAVLRADDIASALIATSVLQGAPWPSDEARESLTRYVTHVLCGRYWGRYA